MARIRRGWTARTRRTRIFRFLDLPPEIRNLVYEFAAGEQDGDIDIFRPLPKTSQICRQLRKESLTLYLGHNTFIAHDIPENINYLVHWLDTIGSENRKCLKLLTIEVILRCKHVSFGPAQYYGDHRRWHGIVACLAAFDIRPNQIRWRPSWSCDIAGRKAVVALREAVDLYFFAKFTLEPLLTDHNLNCSGDDSRNALNVLAELQNLEELHAPGSESRDDIVSAIRSLRFWETEFKERDQSNLYAKNSPIASYTAYVEDVLSTTPSPKHSLLGMNSDLRYLHRSSELRHERYDQVIQDALQHAIGLHRGCHRDKRELALKSKPRRIVLSSDKPSFRNSFGMGHGRGFSEAIGSMPNVSFGKPAQPKPNNGNGTHSALSMTIASQAIGSTAQTPSLASKPPLHDLPSSADTKTSLSIGNHAANSGPFASLQPSSRLETWSVSAFTQGSTTSLANRLKLKPSFPVRFRTATLTDATLEATNDSVSSIATLPCHILEPSSTFDRNQYSPSHSEAGQSHDDVSKPSEGPTDLSNSTHNAKIPLHSNSDDWSVHDASEDSPSMPEQAGHPQQPYIQNQSQQGPSSVWQSLRYTREIRRLVAEEELRKRTSR